MHITIIHMNFSNWCLVYGLLSKFSDCISTLGFVVFVITDTSDSVTLEDCFVLVVRFEASLLFLLDVFLALDLESAIMKYREFKTTKLNNN